MFKPEDCKGIKLLYVEDEPESREATLRIFSKFFENITVAVDGVDGLDKFVNGSFDIVVTDINMPKMNGLEMLEKILEHNSDIYTVVISANSDHKSFTDAITLGVKGYILKPINGTQFVNTLHAAVKNVNALKRLNILTQYKDIVDRSAIVSKSDPQGKITYVNEKFCEISGYREDELIGKNHNILRHPDMPSSVFADMWKTITNKEVWRGQVKNLKKDGSSYYVDAMICPIFDANDEIIEYIGLRNDISEIINPKKQLIDEIKLSTRPVLAILKIDGFETMEHIYNRGIIEEFEDRFFEQIGSNLPVGCEFENKYYLGEGEYALLHDMNDSDDNASQKELQLKKLQTNIRQTVIEVEEYDIDANVIISFSTAKDNIYENVKYGITHAIEKKLDMVFANDLTQNIKDEAVKNTKTVKMIQTAIDNNKIVSYFQPIINNKTNEIEKYESLVRLIDEDGKVVSPFFFLEVAKEARYYNKITNIVIENSFAALEKTDKEISINLSALDIEDIDIRNKLINLVTINMDNAHRIVFELLEDEEVKDFEVVKDFISLVKAFGVQIAIDDFGAGVSNFERLLDYQPDILKIDACLIKNIETDKYSRDVVDTIQIFAWKQGIKTVSEFVASEGILKTVKDIGINYSQGFLLGKPEPLS